VGVLDKIGVCFENDLDLSELVEFAKNLDSDFGDDKIILDKIMGVTADWLNEVKLSWTIFGFSAENDLYQEKEE
jgi:hypothetical protein